MSATTFENYSFNLDEISISVRLRKSVRGITTGTQCIIEDVGFSKNGAYCLSSGIYVENSIQNSLESLLDELILKESQLKF